MRNILGVCRGTTRISSAGHFWFKLGSCQLEILLVKSKWNNKYIVIDTSVVWFVRQFLKKKVGSAFIIVVQLLRWLDGQIYRHSVSNWTIYIDSVCIYIYISVVHVQVNEYNSRFESCKRTVSSSRNTKRWYRKKIKDHRDVSLFLLSPRTALMESRGEYVLSPA